MIINKLVYSQDAIKMHVFLQFIFNAEALKEHVRDEWIKLYDFTYIDDKIIGAVERLLPSVGEILATIEKKATGQVVSSLTQSSFSVTAAATESTKKKTPTKPKPFNLTKPKPKVIEKPIPLKREVKANPVPKILYRKTLAEIEKEKQERRK
jgi:hypothetical protein